MVHISCDTSVTLNYRLQHHLLFHSDLKDIALSYPTTGTNNLFTLFSFMEISRCQQTQQNRTPCPSSFRTPTACCTISPSVTQSWCTSQGSLSRYPALSLQYSPDYIKTPPDYYCQYTQTVTCY